MAFSRHRVRMAGRACAAIVRSRITHRWIRPNEERMMDPNPRHLVQPAAELTQEAFVRLIREEQAGRGPDQVRAWLFRVATNLAMSRARRRTVARRHEETLGRQWFESINSQNESIRRDDWRRARQVLDELPKDARTAVVLAAEGYTGREIATRIGRSEPATRTLLCRARDQLRRRFAATEAADEARSDPGPRAVRPSWAATV